MRQRSADACTGLLLAMFLFGGAACNNLLEVENIDSPDVDTTLATADGILALTATLYRTIWSTSNGSLTPGSPAPIYPSLMSMSFETFSQSDRRNRLPRDPISNARNDIAALENFRDFSGLSRNSRSASNVIVALDRLLASGQSLGSAGVNARSAAFAYFANGVSLGNLALAYDSAAIVTPGTPDYPSPRLSAASALMKVALSSLDSSIAIAGSPAATGGFPLPSTWMNGRALSAAEFVRVVRSYRARLRASVARTPDERAAVDWSQVIADVENGVPVDLNVLLDPAAGWANSWFTTHFLYGAFHQMTPMIIGMADTSGAYDAWLQLPLSARTPFLIKTPDRRFPAGETRTAQIANSPTSPVSPLYFRNRALSADLSTQSWGSSYYDFYRWQPLNAAGNRGDFPLITRAEMDLLAAEGHLRQGRITEAARLIDKYRLRAGLPLLAGIVTTISTPVPGGRACVPRVPMASGTSTECGTIFEAMKWEKRMETAFTGWQSWYFDSRGWGDLPEGTALEYPVPFQELDAREKPLYNLGGIGGKSAAPKGTYGF